MMTKHMRKAIAAALFVTFGALLSAQSASTVSTRVRDAMTTQESGWQLEKSLVEATQFLHRWVNRAEDIVIMYEQRASEAEATEWLEQRPLTISAPGGEPLTSVGAQALIWSGTSKTGSATVYFRKGRATVGVTAPSRAMAIRIGQLVALQIYE